MLLELADELLLELELLEWLVMVLLLLDELEEAAPGKHWK